MSADAAPVPAMNDRAAVAEWERLLGQPEVVEAIRDAVTGTIAHVERDLMESSRLRLPRRAEERQNGFEKWLAEYREGLAESLFRELAGRLGGTAESGNDPEPTGADLATRIWPLVEAELQARAERFLVHHAVRGLALNWLSRHIGEGLVVAEADHLGKFWRVSLLDKRDRGYVAALALDEDGNVLTEVPALRAALTNRGFVTRD